MRYLKSTYAAVLLAIGTAVPHATTLAQEVKVAAEAPLRLLDPVGTTAYITRNHAYMVYDTLFALDAQLKPQPQMVSTWSVSPDKLVYRFTLRDGLKFHDGSPVTAADCVASIKRWAQRDLTGLRMMAAAKEITAKDDKTFEIVLEQPFGAVIEGLSKASSLPAFIMPKRIADAPASQAITEVIGSGPFRFVASEYRPGLQVVYERNTDYVPRSEPPSGLAGGKVVNVDRVVWLSLPDIQTEANALAKGEVDYVQTVYPDVVQTLEASKDVVIQKLASTTTPTLRLNWLQPPFNNQKVRQALLHAVSQRDYMDAQVGDPKAYRVCWAMFGCDSPLASTAGVVSQDDEADLNAAKALLKESGYKNEKAVVLHATDYPPTSAIAPFTAQILRSIGMKAEVQSMDWATFLTRRGKQDPVEKGGWSVAYGSWNTLDLMSPIANLNLDGRGKEGYAGWTESVEMESLRTQYAQATEPASRQQIAAKIQQLAYDQVFYIPLGTYSNYAARRSNVTPLLDAPVTVFWGISKN
ncbi:ABC transporter substrate-binding protein [Bordetella bronchiseptica]|uniref:ABC transporter substrate-binding protein n=1 Tax=Bordetella bronchiseptica TaxID=518 RepID=UPI00028B8D0B|nr:ABC transporter substrate-binding protein [Bordetella bronchiseptica]KAK51353.1 ABC transporter, substrate-binding protein, family 5 [Bordetella bronchiseptica OSU054]KDB75955.1 ABC transporter, substrate-binding protein, family 5 [Bordetella bronchiseptica CA90 BB1334]KDC14466.1 ABC transporter, substrate-binding protein, family 5 [Bordetella bronchiseptica E014]KDC18193.1 ABC transporter, substrate-binding protein, family 5 [Bordetella bronchiseptica F-1]KDC29845.1 ABC transporter, substr